MSFEVELKLILNSRIEGRTNKQYLEDNKNRYKTQRMNRYENNIDMVKAQRNKYYEDNKGRIKEQIKIYYDANTDKIKAQKNEYCLANKDKIKERDRLYRANNKKQEQTNTV